jgi:hypothetical protein
MGVTCLPLLRAASPWEAIVVKKDVRWKAAWMDRRMDGNVKNSVQHIMRVMNDKYLLTPPIFKVGILHSPSYMETPTKRAVGMGFVPIYCHKQYGEMSTNTMKEDEGPPSSPILTLALSYRVPSARVLDGTARVEFRIKQLQVNASATGQMNTWETAIVRI